MSRTQLIVLSAFWISVLPNLATLRKFISSPSSGEGLSWVFFVGTGWLATFSVVLIFLTLFGMLFPKRGVKIWCSFIIILATVLGYFSLRYGTYFDRTMFTNMLGTHPSEIRELFSLGLLGWVICVGLLPAMLILRTELKLSSSWKSEALLTLTTLLLPLLVTLALIHMQMNRFASAGRNKSISVHTLAPQIHIVSATFFPSVGGQAEILPASHFRQETRCTDDYV